MTHHPRAPSSSPFNGAPKSGQSIVPDKATSGALAFPSRNGLPWTPAEDAIMREHYPLIGAAVLHLLPGRSRGGMSRRAHCLGLGRNGAVAEAVRAALENIPLRPKCLRGCRAEVGSSEWAKRQDAAFRAAMEAHPEERPSSYTMVENGAGSRR